MGELFQRRKKDRRLVLTLPAQAAVLLRQIIVELGEMFSAPTPGAVSDRLFPRAYLDPTEEAAEEQWTALVHPELLRQRLEGLDELLRTLDGGVTKGKRTQVTLSPDNVNLWLGVLNDARLAFGTRLDITDDTNIWYSPPDDPLAAERAAYAWLTTLQGLLVDTMLGTLPDT